MTTPRYVIMTTRAAVPGPRRQYDAQRTALVEVEPGFQGTPAAISARAAGVRRIVCDYGTDASGSGAVAAGALKARLEAQAAA
jgi:hypothetical protein